MLHYNITQKKTQAKIQNEIFLTVQPFPAAASEGPEPCARKQPLCCFTDKDAPGFRFRGHLCVCSAVFRVIRLQVVMNIFDRLRGNRDRMVGGADIRELLIPEHQLQAHRT